MPGNRRFKCENRAFAVQNRSIQLTSGPLPDGLYPASPHGATTYTPTEYVAELDGATNAVVSSGDVTDESAVFVADPFMYLPDGDDPFTDWHMFFETQRASYAVIGHATSTDAGQTWTYDQTVIDAGSHLSMPLVFRVEGAYYMLPNRGANDYQPLYKTGGSFPYGWTEVDQWFSAVGHPFKDYLLYWHDSRWWFVCGTDDGGTNGGIRVYYSDLDDSIESVTWNAHPDNPVVSGRPSAARGAGRGLKLSDGTLVAFFQDCVAEYGDKVRAYEITELSTTGYADTELAGSPILEGSGTGWNDQRMHQYDPWWVAGENKWIAATDGTGGNEWSIGMYQSSEAPPPPPPTGPALVNSYALAGDGTDSVGSNDLTATNMSWPTDGTYGTVADFTGSSYLSGATIPELSVSSPFTATCLVNVDSYPGSGSTVILNQTIASSDRFGFSCKSNGEIAAGFYTGSFTNCESATVATGGWVRLTYTWDGATGTFYVDGVSKVGSQTPSTAPDTGLFLGARSDVAKLFNGKLSAFEVYDDAMTEAEVQEL